MSNRDVIIISGDALMDGKSVDVKRSDGTLLMRLNLFDHGPLVGPSIDVIFAPNEITNYAVQSWLKGARVILEYITGGLISVSRANK